MTNINLVIGLVKLQLQLLCYIVIVITLSV